MKTFIRVITITIVLALFITGSVSPVTAQVSQTNQPSESVGMAISRSPGNEALTRLQMTLGATMHSHGGVKVLVIPTAQIQPQQMATLIEDMTVMCRIFDKKMDQSNLKRTMSFYGMTLPGHISMSIGSDSPEAMYVQGYGALFMTTVDFLLSAPPQTEQKEETEEEQEADPVWKQMRQEIFSPQQAVKPTTERPEEKYDPEKVENLKTTLIKSLLHAANIRGLNQDESVIITVTGKAGPRILGARGGAMYYGGNEDSKIISKEDIVSSQMVLVIRAKKSDIDAYAKNQIDLDEFKQKVKVISYPRIGGDLGHDPSNFFLPGSGFSVPSSSTQPAPGSGTRRSGSSRRGRGTQQRQKQQ